MPTLATEQHAQSPVSHGCAPRSHGFSLLEMLLVVAIVGLASGLVLLALRDASQHQLDQLGQRLAVDLEKGRAQSRAQNTPLWWYPTPQGYAISPEPPPPPGRTQAVPAHTMVWTEPDLQSDSAPVQLGPEPILPPTRIRLWQRDNPQRILELHTDGLRPFALASDTL